MKAVRGDAIVFLTKHAQWKLIKLTTPNLLQLAAIVFDKTTATMAVTIEMTATDIPYALFMKDPNMAIKRIIEAAMIRK